MLRPFSQLVFLLALYPAIALATPRLEDGYAAFEQGDTDKAVAIWRELAEQGNATAQLNLGQLYRLGKGVPRDDAEAVNWYIHAARNNSNMARYTLGLMHHEGRATDEDLLEAGLAVQAPLATSHAPDTSPAASVHYTQREWLHQLPADAYLIQILASSNRQALEKYAGDHLSGVTPTPEVIRTLHEGQNWYQLVMGPFSSPESAHEAMARLPFTVRKNEPWLRTAGSLQSIKRN